MVDETSSTMSEGAVSYTHLNTDALLEALDTGKVSGYMTDFPSEDLLGRPGVICTPHLGASCLLYTSTSMGIIGCSGAFL